MLGAEAREANKAWLTQQVNGVLEPLMLEIVREKPENVVSKARNFNIACLLILIICKIVLQLDYMVKFMEREYGERALNGDRAQLGILQAKVADLEAKLEQMKAEKNTDDTDRRSDRGSEHETESSVSTFDINALRSDFE